jgi:hypothetical protein
MKAKLQIQRVEDCNEWLETVADQYNNMQSIAWYIDQIGVLVKTFAFINTQVAVSKEILNRNKKEAYAAMMLSAKGNGFAMSPMLAKDYINAAISEHQYNYDICDRTRSTLDLTIEALRSCLSALKSEYSVTRLTL